VSTKTPVIVNCRDDYFPTKDGTAMKNKKLYARDLISKIELDNSERALKNVQLGAERIRELIADHDQALMLAGASARGLQKVSNLRGYHETANLIRYNGAAHWSLAEAEKVAKFYRQQFGELLPVSARGQSRTHDRLGLDHRDALDVALQPDSAEGRGLMAYLRDNGIPFIAFRNRVRGMSTGAHIHIGPPSPPIMQVKRPSTQHGAMDKNSNPA
jgi:hypothetical protein